MTIKLFLNLFLTLLITKDKATKSSHNLSKNHSQHSLTIFSYTLLQKCTFVPSHTPTQYSLNLPTSHTIFIHTLIHLVYTHTYIPCTFVHTLLDTHQISNLHTLLPTISSLHKLANSPRFPYPIISKSYILLHKSLTQSLTTSHPLHNPTHSLHTLDLHHPFQINTSQSSIFPTCQIV